MTCRAQVIEKAPKELTLEEVILVIADRDAAAAALDDLSQQLSQAYRDVHRAAQTARTAEAAAATESAGAVIALKREMAKLKYLWATEKEELFASRDDAQAAALELQELVRLLTLNEPFCFCLPVCISDTVALVREMKEELFASRDDAQAAAPELQELVRFLPLNH